MLNHCSLVLNETLNHPCGGLDLTNLVIIHENTCWILHIDILILDYGGNLMDTVFMAVRGALGDTLLPKVTVEETDGDYEYEVADEETEPIDCTHVPLSTTFFMCEKYILDPIPREEMCCSFQLSVIVNSNGRICGLQKNGIGSASPSLISEMIQVLFNVNMNLYVF